MGMMETSQGSREAASVDMERFRLRTFVESLGDDECERRAERTDLADLASQIDGNPKAVLFQSVGPEGQELVANVCSSRSRLARAFGVTAERGWACDGTRYILPWVRSGAQTEERDDVTTTD